MYIDIQRKKTESYKMLNENWRRQEEYTTKKKQRMTTMNKSSYVYGCIYD